MKERPILMSAPMVRSTLDDTKLQTRRAVTHPVLQDLPTIRDIGNGWWGDDDFEARCPYGQPGDRLWVREAFRFPVSVDHLSPAEIGQKALAVGYPKPWCPTQFEADGLRRTPQEWRDFVTPPQANEAGRRRAGMHMPRWASRITLEITSVRVQRLQDISEADALVEGIVATRGGFGLADGSHYHATDPRISYWSLWDAINGPGSAEANPWVWAVAFKRMKGTP
jgi:hypothetical protein